MGLQVRDVIEPGRNAKIDSTTRAFVGHDLFFFTDAAARARFLEDPLRWCGKLTDPVTQRRFRPSHRSPHLAWRGRPYWFASDSTFMVFRAMPDSFAIRKGM